MLPETGMLAAIKCPFSTTSTWADSQPLSQCGSKPGLPWDSSVMLWHVHRTARALGSPEEGGGRALSPARGKQAVAALNPPELPVGLDPTAAASMSQAQQRTQGTQVVPRHPTESRCLTGWLGRRALYQQQQGARMWKTGSQAVACSGPGWIQEEGFYSSFAGGWMQQGLFLGPQQEKAQLLPAPSHGYGKASLEQPCLQVSAARGRGHQQQPQTAVGSRSQDHHVPGLRAQ